MDADKTVQAMIIGTISADIHHNISRWPDAQGSLEERNAGQWLRLLEVLGDAAQLYNNNNDIENSVRVDRRTVVTMEDPRLWHVSLK